MRNGLEGTAPRIHPSGLGRLQSRLARDVPETGPCAAAHDVELAGLMDHLSADGEALRYMKHAPESYFAEDAAKVAASISGERNREAEAQAALARESIRPA